MLTPRLSHCSCSVYNLAQRPTFPDTHQVLKLEDRLFAWRRDLPEHLSNPNKAPKHGPFRDQALKLQLRLVLE